MVDSVGAVQDAVRAGPRVLPVGGATEPALSSALADGVTLLDVSALQGVIEYNPAEMTVTARAGTRIAAVTDLLAEHDQYLPFDPPLGAAGATLEESSRPARRGPTPSAMEACASSSSACVCRRDWARAVGRWQCGQECRRLRPPEADGRVDGPPGCADPAGVQGLPAAARDDDADLRIRFDRGRVGPRVPPRARTVRVRGTGPRATGRVLARIGGEPVALDARARRIDETVALPSQRLRGEEDAALWRAASDLAWSPAERRDPRRADATSGDRPRGGAQRCRARARYSLATNVAWVSWPPGAESSPWISLKQLGLTGVVLVGPPREGLLGAARGGVFAARLRRALDPHDRFVSL